MPFATLDEWEAAREAKRRLAHAQVRREAGLKHAVENQADAMKRR
jgi:hypothetical protein